MNYCKLDQWVIIPATGQIGRVVEIINRRDHKRDGKVVVQCGAGGPFLEVEMGMLEEASQKNIDIAEGVRNHDDVKYFPDDPFGPSKPL